MCDALGHCLRPARCRDAEATRTNQRSYLVAAGAITQSHKHSRYTNTDAIGTVPLVASENACRLHVAISGAVQNALALDDAIFPFLFFSVLHRIDVL